MVKESKKINDLISEIEFFIKEEDDLDLDYGMLDICDFADCYAMENFDKARSDHFNSHIQDGIRMAERSQKTGKPIYTVWAEDADIIFYFVDDLDKILSKLKEKFAAAKLRAESYEDEEIEELETKLKELKKKKKK